MNAHKAVAVEEDALGAGGDSTTDGAEGEGIEMDAGEAASDGGLNTDGGEVMVRECHEGRMLAPQW